MSTVWRRFVGGVTALLVGLVMAFQFTGSAYAADAAINETNFPDANFRNYVSTTFDTSGDGILQQSEADAVTDMDASVKSITSLQGVEHFTKLTTLNARSNRLTAVDLSANTNLVFLDLSFNRLTAVDLSANTNLTELYLANWGNSHKLTAVDLSANTKLTKLDLCGNELTAVDLKANTNLTDLDLSINELTAVDLKANTKLTKLDLSDNQFAAVDLSANTNLTELDLSGWLSNPRLAAVDLSANTNLIKLYLSYNKLTAVDLSANTNLTRLDLDHNELTDVDLSANTNLVTLDLSGNRLTAVDLSANTDLGDSDLDNQGRVVRVPESSRLVPVNQLSAGFDAGKVSNLVGATIVDGRLQVDEGASRVFYEYSTGNGTVLPMPVDLQVTVASGYTVSFDMGGHGSQVAAQSVLEGEQASAPAAPSAEGWEFKGWYTDNTFATAFDFSAPINADVTVYAKWEKAGGQPATQPTVVRAKKKVPKTGGESSFGFAGVGAIVAAGVAAGWLFRRRNA